MKKGKQKLGFMLIELVTVIGLLSVFLAFLAKLNFFSRDPERMLKLATKMLVSGFDNVRSQAIANNRHACVAIDTSSKYRFRRIVLCLKEGDFWKVKHVLILPERIFILPSSELSNRFSKDLSNYTYVEGVFNVNGEIITCYNFIFNNAGVLSHGEKEGAIVVLSYGINCEEDVKFESDSPLMGIFIAPAGQQIVLKSRQRIEEVL